MEEYYKTITNYKELDECIEYANNKFTGQGQVWWRGQRSYKWNLQPGLFRDRDNVYDEYSGMLRFMKKAINKYDNPPNNNDYPGWLCLMRHYGLPSRLLDWTEKPFFAAYFATEIYECHKKHKEKIEDDDGALFALSPYLLNKSQNLSDKLLVAENPPAKNIIDRAFGNSSKEIKKIVAIRPAEVDDRPQAQLSGFTLFGFDKPLDQISENDNFIIKFRISKIEKCKIREALKQRGVRLSDIYPDLDHLAIEISELNFNVENSQPPYDDNNDYSNLNLDDYSDPGLGGECSTSVK